MRVKFYHFFVLDLKALVLKAGKHQISVKLLHLNHQIESGVLQEPYCLVFFTAGIQGISITGSAQFQFLGGKRNNAFLCSLLWVYNPNKHYFLLVKKL